MHHFLDLVAERVDIALDASQLAPGQRDLLCAAIERRRVTRRGNDLGNPVSLFWLVVRALKRPVDETALALAAFCEFYMFSLWLFDDIQDDELSKTVFAKAGPAIAVNSALIFFCLALNELRLAIEGEPDLERRRGYLRLFTSLALSAGNGQYLDLVSSHGRPTPSEVFAIASTKASAARLLFDLASMFGSDDSRIASLYRSIGEDVTIIGQLVDDMSDLFSGRKSSDLASGRVTYPLACFAEVAGATGDAELSRLRNSMPSSLPAIRRLLYESGAVEMVASTIEGARSRVHSAIAALDDPCAEHRTLLFGVDTLCRMVYKLPDLQCTRLLRNPTGRWHDDVKAGARQFFERMTAWGAPEPPPFLPWHLPQWVYDPEQRLIYYPDLDGLPEETLSLQAMLLDLDDLGAVRAVVEEQAAAVMAHEMFHYWRDISGHLSADKWLEERVANALSLAYCRVFEPSSFSRTLELSRSVFSRWQPKLSTAGQEVLTVVCNEQSSAGFVGYGVDGIEMAVIQLGMIVRLAENLPPLEELIEEHLGAGE